MSPLEDRSLPGSMLDGVLAAALGGIAGDPLAVMAGAVGDQALLGTTVTTPTPTVELTPPEPGPDEPPTPPSAVAADEPVDAPAAPPSDPWWTDLGFAAGVDPDELAGPGVAPAGLSTGEPPAGPGSGAVDAGNPAAAGGPAGATDASGAAGLPPAPEAASGPAALPPDPVPAADGPTTTTAMSATSAASPAPPEVEPAAPLTTTADPSPTGSATGDPTSNGPATDESSSARSATATDDPASLTAASAMDDGPDAAGVPPAAVTATPALGDTLRVPCAFGPGLAGWTVAESGGTALGRGTVVADGADFVLREGDSFATTVARDLTLSAHPGWVVFEYAGLAFDETDADAINDAFEVALLDARDRPLVPTIGVGGDQPKRDAFFNVTEGVGVARGAGV